MLSVLGIFCLQELVVWVMCRIGNFVFWKFSVILLCEFCALCIGNFLFAGIGCVDYVGSELRIFYLQKFLVWIM